MAEAKKDAHQNVAFFTAERPAYFDPHNPGASAVKLAQELFSFTDADINAKHGGRYYGQGKYGYTYEVSVKREATIPLSARAHPNVLDIYD